MNGVARAVAAWERELRDLLLPRGCAGCDLPDETLCAQCRESFARHRQWTLHRDGVRIPCFACADYRGVIRRAILSWKDHDDVELDGPLAECMADLAAQASMAVAVAAQTSGRMLVVPVPSSAASRRRRGRAHVLPLARGVAKGLREAVPDNAGVGVAVADVLRVSGVNAKSVQASDVRHRARRLDGRLRVASGGFATAGARSLQGAAVVLVDDIVTTGSTLAHCARVVEAAGGRVAATFALARTPAPGEPGECGPDAGGLSASSAA